MTDITSANSTLTVAVTSLLPVPFNVQGYAADEAFMTDSIDVAETMMGVDGKLSAGYTPVIVPLTITLQADSPSISLFDSWLGAQEAGRQIFTAVATLTLPSVAKSYIFTKGVLKSVKKFPDGKKVLQPVQYKLEFESCTAIPL